MSPLSDPSRRWGWSPAEVVGLLCLLGTGVLLMWDAWSDIFLIALRDEEQSHILLVPVIAAWLAWMRRARLRHCPRDQRWIGPAFVAIGWGLYSLGDLTLTESLWHLGAIVVAVGCLLSFSGARYFPRLRPACAVRAVLVPVPGFVRVAIAHPLQEATAEATRRVLSLVGVEAARSGSTLSVNGRDILIAEACNGLRMVFALMLISYAFAYSTPIRNGMRVLIVAVSPMTAILCNVVRLVPTVWVHGFVSAEAGERMHGLGGWVMLPVAFLLLLGMFRTLRWALVPVYRYTLAYGK